MLRKLSIAIVAGAASVLLAGGIANAAYSHTGYCRYGEYCGVVVSKDIYEAQRICSRSNQIAVRVTQQQRDGSYAFIGYVCASRTSDD